MEASLMASFPISRPSLPFPKSMLNPSPKPAFPRRNLSGHFASRAKTAINSSSSSSCKNLHLTEETTDSFYCLLGVSEAATSSEIKQAYKKLVLKYHPDVSPADSAREFTRRFIRIQEAYETLSDPATRALYDFTHLAPFSPHTLFHSCQPGMDESGHWKRRWQIQLEELERKSRNKDSKDRKSWAARVRMQRMESSI